MVYDVRKADRQAPPRSIILRERPQGSENAPSSNTQQNLNYISTATSSVVVPFQSGRVRTRTAGFNQHDDNSTRPSNSRSKIVVLKLGSGLKVLGDEVSALRVSKIPGAKLVTLRAFPELLAQAPSQKPDVQEPPMQTTLDGNGAEKAMAEPPEVRHRRPAISVSDTGSPLRTGNDQPRLKSGPGILANTSKQQLETTSDFGASPTNTYETTSGPFSLSRGRPPSPFHHLINLSSDRQQMSRSALNQQLDTSPSSRRKLPLEFRQQLHLAPENQWQDSPSQFNRQIRDPRVSWQIRPATLKDLSRPMMSLHTARPYNSYASYAPSYVRVLMNSPPLLPPAMSAAFAAEGWNQNSDIGIHGLSASVPITTDPDDLETPNEFNARLIYVLGQMMFVSGETAEASPETTGMIEEIVRAQVIEMLKQATELANRRGVRSISTADLIFLIRHDKAKVSRLKTFLSWKDVRKNVKDSDEKGGGDAGEVDFDDGANLPGAGPVDSKKSTNKKAKLILPWEVQSFYSEQVPERDDEEDNEEEEEQNEATLARLASADERTKNMTRDEYVYWSDCRQASFTFRKGKRFREWAGFGVVTDSKPNDDIVDILGFLTFEIVQTLTEEALKVKAAEDLHNARTSSAAGGETKKRKREGSSLFEMPEEGRTPVEPKHVREAFRRLQIVPKKYGFMRSGYTGIKQPLRLI